ncbi:MAG: hypothetical protein COU46_01545 [Candidatus Niyogibacteria bacterium CG10_big_fil_rev_8_21_14_0_10_42_19]|uniref:Uncharacterized protein n=1 Tax=Candidatus Niyogibacteria bacterium CG10_big_fil_rev_8_21_14_0_10_42_19 TaxID=1974725 RepID=A0A2H0TFS4_9BACT|nr:MAG: hypothetical protein COU46_01545 [Candidatus Niyogibacteria bacterium CG10_big_fil_rev_8_21_14_0_10_42_19]
MKNFLIRSTLFIIMMAGSFYDPWLFIFFSLIFIVFFKKPTEAFIGAIILESITGFYYGMIVLPLLAAYLVRYFISTILKESTFFPAGVSFAASFLVFIAAQFLFMLFIGGIGVMGFPVMLEVSYF